MIGNGIEKILGFFGDIIHVPYVHGVNTIMGFLQTGYYHIHGAGSVYPLYADAVVLTSAAGAWNTTGNIVEVIPANAIVKDFDIHFITVYNISANAQLVIDLFSGAPGQEILIRPVDINRGDNFSAEIPRPIMIKQQPKNTRISARLTDSTASAKTCGIKLDYHVYGTSLT